MSKNDSLVKKLIDSKADVQASSARMVGCTAIWAAAIIGTEALVHELLAADAIVNAQRGQEYGRTALPAACFGGDMDVCLRSTSAWSRRQCTFVCFQEPSCFNARL